MFHVCHTLLAQESRSSISQWQCMITEQTRFIPCFFVELSKGFFVVA